MERTKAPSLATAQYRLAALVVHAQTERVLSDWHREQADRLRGTPCAEHRNDHLLWAKERRRRYRAVMLGCTDPVTLRRYSVVGALREQARARGGIWSDWAHRWEP